MKEFYTVDIPEDTDVFFAPKLNSRWTGHTFGDNWYDHNNYHYPRKNNGNQNCNDFRKGTFTGQHFMFGHSYAYCYQMGTGEMPDESYGTLSERYQYKHGARVMDMKCEGHYEGNAKHPHHHVFFNVTFLTDRGETLKFSVGQTAFDRLSLYMTGDLVTVNGNFFDFSNGEEIE